MILMSIKVCIVFLIAATTLCLSYILGTITSMLAEKAEKRLKNDD